MKKGYKRGLTLIELLVVVAIITVLAAILLPYISNRAEDAKIARMEGEISELRTAVTLFFNDNSTLPSIWNDFVNPGTTFTNWRGPYINKAPNPGTSNLWNAASPWKTNYRIWGLVGATADNRFAAANNLYPFRNAFALEVENPLVSGSPTISLTSLQKIDNDMDNNLPGAGFMVEATANTNPFVTTTSMAGLNTGTNYLGGGRSFYVLLFTY